jgi:hypothetical protein
MLRRIRSSRVRSSDSDQFADVTAEKTGTKKSGTRIILRRTLMALASEKGFSTVLDGYASKRYLHESEFFREHFPGCIKVYTVLHEFVLIASCGIDPKTGQDVRELFCGHCNWVTDPQNEWFEKQTWSKVVQEVLKWLLQITLILLDATLYRSTARTC